MVGNTAEYRIMSPESRVWVYLADRTLSTSESEELRQKLQSFARSWVSHNKQLKAYADVLHQRFLLLMVDESQAGASGCSIDTSVRFLQGIEHEFGIEVFNRWLFGYREAEGVKVVTKDEFSRLYKEGQISDDTLVFDNLVSTKAAFDQQWLKPLAESWHRRLL